MEGVELAPELVEEAVTVATDNAPTLGYNKTKIEIRKDGRALFNVRVDIDSDMKGMKGIVYAHLTHSEREQIKWSGADGECSTFLDSWRY
jgi:hypothetical protein